MAVEGLYTNHPDHGGSIESIVKALAKDAYNIKIASAFFTEADLLNEFLIGGASIRLVFRLGYPTHPKAIYKLLFDERIKMRFFTDRYFHPKLYLFDEDLALVGSANLTSSAFHVNQEIMVAIDSNDERFSELELLFRGYWEDARVLTPKLAKEYSELWTKHEKSTWGVDMLESDLLKSFGKVSASVIQRPGIRKPKSEILYETFKRDYQEVLNAFSAIRRIYESIGKRKASDSQIPLRLEIDSFISFVRDTDAKLSNWSSAPLLNPVDREEKIGRYIEKWHNTNWPYFENKIVPELYPKIKGVFESKSSIDAASDDELLDALAVLHSFITRRRFEEGGLNTLKKNLLQNNGRAKLNSTLTYLLFGPGEIMKRMCECLFDPDLRLYEFGSSNVQEFVGWLNKQELPIINMRTRKVFRFFGFDIWGE